MIKTATFALTAALLTAASPAFADLAKTAADPSSQPTEIAIKPAAKPVQYCVEEQLTGSMLKRRICNTRDQWMAQGFDPLAK